MSIIIEIVRRPVWIRVVIGEGVGETRGDYQRITGKSGLVFHPVMEGRLKDEDSLLLNGGGADIADDGFGGVGAAMNISHQLSRLHVEEGTDVLGRFLD